MLNKSAFLALLFCMSSVAIAQRYDPSKWTNIRVNKLPGNINSPKIETAGCFSPNGDVLWFSSKRGTGQDLVSTCDYRFGKFDEPVIGSNPVASGAMTIDQNEQAYFAMTDPVFDTLHPNDVNIYRVLKETGGIERLPSTINTKKWESQPHISRDGRTLYYSSAIGSTKTEYNVDILFSTLRDGTWTPGTPLGSDINTLAYEGFSAVSPDGRYLFFTRRTDRKHPAIFCCPIGAAGRGEIIRLPEPINTGHEMSIAFHPTENLFIIASARESADEKDYDLYEVRYDLKE